MPRFLIFARYSEDELNALVEDEGRVEAREANADRFYGALGGKMIDGFFFKSGEWHFGVIAEFPDSQAAHAATMAAGASGSFDAGAIYEIASIKEGAETFRMARQAAMALFQAP